MNGEQGPSPENAQLLRLSLPHKLEIKYFDTNNNSYVKVYFTYKEGESRRRHMSTR